MPTNQQPRRAFQAAAWTLLTAGVLLASGYELALAQQQANPPAFVPMPAPGGSTAGMSRYERRQGGTGEVYRRDPNIWVYTPEIARQADMPQQWASTELKGVVAAAFRVEPEGAEMDCGFGGNRNACKPVINCITELYFDRNAPQPPWNMKMQVADYNPLIGSSARHSGLWGADQQRRRGREPEMISSPVFTDPDTGARLDWKRADTPVGLGFFTVVAYDREIHGSLSYLKLQQGCGTGPAQAQPHVLQLVRANNQTLLIERVLHEVHLPADWVRRVGEERNRAAKAEEDFFRNTWQGMQRGSAAAAQPPVPTRPAPANPLRGEQP